MSIAPVLSWLGSLGHIIYIYIYMRGTLIAHDPHDGLSMNFELMGPCSRRAGD